MERLLPSTRSFVPAVPADFEHLETVVTVGYPVRSARAYLARHMGNPIRYRLVEARRGEALGIVREVQVNPAEGGDPIHVKSIKVLPDGRPAPSFTPEGLIHLEAELSTSDGRMPSHLDPRDEVVLHVPVRSYLRFLPGVYRGAVPAERGDAVPVDEISANGWASAPTPEELPGVDVDALRRFLFLFQHLMTTVVDEIEALPDLTNPLTCDARFLTWIASWVGFTLDNSLPVYQQRELVRRAIRLYRTRGTRRGLEEMIRVLTSAPVQVQPRVRPQPFVLGGSTVAGGATVAERYGEAEPPGNYLYPQTARDTAFFEVVLEKRERFHRRFSQRAPAVLRRIAQIVTAEKPAHVTFTIRFEDEDG